MRAFVINELVHPSKLTISTDVPVPVPGPRQVLVEVFAVGINFGDILQAQGKYQEKPKLPFVLGNEFAGRITDDSPIPEASGLKPGQRVFGSMIGAFADKMVVNIDRLWPLPDNITYEQGAGMFVSWPTSYEALVNRAHMKAGDWVLVMAAAGGVGIAAVQIAKALGAHVIAAAGSQEKIDVAVQFGGADYGINYSEPGWQKRVLEITKGKGVDIIYDPVGMINEALKCIAWKGRALIIGFAAGQVEKVPMNLVLLKNISLVGLYWGSYGTKDLVHMTKVLEALFELFASGRVKPVHYKEVWGFNQLIEAMDALEKRQTWGKAIVRVKADPTYVEREAKL